MLQVMSTEPSKDRFEFQRLVLLAKDHLHTVESNPSLKCGPDSPVHLAFDPYIGRRLQTATPIRIVTPPSIEDTYKSLHRFIEGLYEVGVLETFDQLSAWEVSNPPINYTIRCHGYSSDCRQPSVMVSETPSNRPVCEVFSTSKFQDSKWFVFTD